MCVANTSLVEAWQAIARVVGLVVAALGRTLRHSRASLLSIHLRLSFISPYGISLTAAAQGFPFRTDLENTIGAAITALGPRLFLTYLPLGIEQTAQTTRLWLLPLLKTYIKNTELGFFGSHFMPLAKHLKERSLQLAAAGKGVEVNIRVFFFLFI